MATLYGSQRCWRRRNETPSTDSERGSTGEIARLSNQTVRPSTDRSVAPDSERKCCHILCGFGHANSPALRERDEYLDHVTAWLSRIKRRDCRIQRTVEVLAGDGPRSYNNRSPCITSF